MLRPTVLEMRMMKIIEKHSLPYVYTGDGSFIIGGKNPDFVNINGKKVCIEIRNPNVTRYFTRISQDSYGKQRKEHFRKYGWECVVVSSDMKDDDISKKVKQVGK